MPIKHHSASTIRTALWITLFSIMGATACSTPSTPTESKTAPAPSATPVLTTQGYGDIRFGDKMSQIPESVRASMKRPIPKDERECTFIEFTQYPNILFMLENDTFTRADMRGNIPNDLKLLIGMSSEEVLRRYPQAVVTQHKYVETGHYLTIWAPDKRSAFVLEEENGRITQIRSGLEPSVSYVEGCS